MENRRTFLLWYDTYHLPCATTDARLTIEASAATEALGNTLYLEGALPILDALGAGAFIRYHHDRLFYREFDAGLNVAYTMGGVAHVFLRNELSVQTVSYTTMAGETDGVTTVSWDAGVGFVLPFKNAPFSFAFEVDGIPAAIADSYEEVTQSNTLSRKPHIYWPDVAVAFGSRLQERFFLAADVSVFRGQNTLYAATIGIAGTLTVTDALTLSASVHSINAFQGIDVGFGVSYAPIHVGVTFDSLGRHSALLSARFAF